MKAQDRDQLLLLLKSRFTNSVPPRHQGVTWPRVLARLESTPTALKTLVAMEASGGEPDVIGHDTATDQFLFCDCASESPVGRRSLCYDREALNGQKEKTVTG